MSETISGHLDMAVSDTDPRVTVRLNGMTGHVTAGGGGLDGYLFVRASDDRERVRLDGLEGRIYAGGCGSAARVFLRRTDHVGGRTVDRLAIDLDAAGANVRAGGNNQDGDLLLFPQSATDIGVDSQASIWLDSGRANAALGGNGRDGDILLFPRTATIAIDESAHASIWLNGDEGNIHLLGGLMPKGFLGTDRQLPGFSIDEGATAAFQGSARYGSIEFTHEHPEASGDREKLRNIWIFHPLLHENSIVFLTPHAGAPCAHAIGNMERRHDITGGTGRFIDVTLLRKLNPGTRVRIVYWIMN
jgi:hypothetical protein